MRRSFDGTLDKRPRHFEAHMAWRDTTRRHSGIALFTSDQLHDGT